MDSQHQNTEQQIWSFIDGQCTPGESSEIERLIRDNQAWDAKYKELLEIHRLLNESELEQPSLRFTKNVMEEIAKLHIAPATKNYINNKIIWGIGGFFILLIVGFLIYGFGQIDWSVQGDTKLPVDFSKVDYSKFFNNHFVNAFMMVNVFLGLILLDRFLANKRKKFRKEA